MLIRIILSVSLVLGFAGFRYLDSFSADVSIEQSGDSSSQELFMALSIPRYCANTFGTTAENASTQTKRLIRRFTRRCNATSPDRPVRRCVNDKFKDKDVDCDGRKNASDNCPNNSNSEQEDSDSDGEGNACETLPPSSVV